MKSQQKIREEYTLGRRLNFVKNPVSMDELREQIKNPGYMHNQFNAKKNGKKWGRKIWMKFLFFKNTLHAKVLTED